MKASRTRFNRDQTILTTFDSGKLIPFYVDEVLPGDTFNVNTSAIIRMTTPKYPVMDDAFIDFYYFYCPNRILWDNFKYFMGEVESTPWMPTKAYKVPQIKIEGSESTPLPKEGTILDYMGVPTKVKKIFRINALPVRAYVKIWNEFFRDENVGNQATIKTDNNTVTYSDTDKNEDETLQKAITGGHCLPVNKFHDYFTSCLPYPQRGPEVTLPMQGNAMIKGFVDLKLKKQTDLNASCFFDGSTTPGNIKDKMYAISTYGGEGQAYVNIGTGTGETMT